jgi:hypothetical protein
MISRFLVGSMACTLLATALSAQTPTCVAQNAGNNISSGALSAFSFAGANGYGWQFTPAQPLLLFSAEVFTESAFLSGQGYMSLEVWDTNLIFQPGQRLGGGSFEVSAALGHEWHGANFDQPVSLNAGQTYWMVWWEPGGSELPYEPGGNPTTTVRWQGGTWVTQANSEAAKWRAYCGLLDQANVTPIGFGCVASTSTLPAMFTNQPATVGNADFQLEAGGFAPGSFGLLILGTDPNFVSFQVPGATGCQLYTDPLSMLAVTTGTGNQTAGHPPAGPGFAGHCAFDFPIPSNPALSGMFISSQFAMLDLAIGTPLPAVFSNGLNLVLQ